MQKRLPAARPGSLPSSESEQEIDQEEHSESRTAKVLVIMTVDWPHMVRMCLEVASAGLQVIVLAPNGHPVHRLSSLATRSLPGLHNARLRRIEGLIKHHGPALVVPGDDGALDSLRSLADGTSATSVHSAIESSLGPASAYPFARKKSRLISLAAEEGVLVPETQVVRNHEHLQRLLAERPLPAVLKLDNSLGGEGVRILSRASEGNDALAQLLRRSGRRKLRAALQLARSPAKQAPTVCLQAYIRGRPANRAVLCRRGEVLAGLSVEVIERLRANGPATVVRALDSAQMAQAAARIVKRLGLSGFAGFDFVLDAAGRAYLLEMNQQPTQICHLGFDVSTHMIGALSEMLVGSRPPLKSLPLRIQEIALFPMEQWRDPTSKYLWRSYHDVPYQWPEFLALYRQPPRLTGARALLAKPKVGIGLVQSVLSKIGSFLLGQEYGR